MYIIGVFISNDNYLDNQDALLWFSACDEWRLLPKPDLHRDVNRFGHSAVVSNGYIVLFFYSYFLSIYLTCILYN